MPSLWYVDSAHIPLPDTVITDVDELKNCIILGFPVYMLHRAQFSYDEVYPTSIKPTHNGLKVYFKNTPHRYAHDLGLVDPTFNHNMGTLDRDLSLFSSQEEVVSFLLQLREVAKSQLHRTTSTLWMSITSGPLD